MNPATLNKNHINLGDTEIDSMDRFMIHGWFKMDYSSTSIDNLLFIIPNSDNTQSQHILSITFNDQVVARVCNVDCVSLTLNEYNTLYTNSIWVFIMAGVQIP